MSSVMTLKSYGTNRFGKIGARRMVSTLPYDAEVEWLAGDGASWIDTGVVASNAIDVEVTAKATSYAGSPYIIGFGPNGDYPYEWTILIRASNSYGGLIFVRGSYDGGVVTVGIPKFTTVRLNKTNVVVNGVSRSYSGADVSPQAGCKVFVFAGGGTDRAFSICGNGIQIKGSRVYSSDVCVRDLAAVRIGSVGAMYDRRGVGGMNPDGSARTDGLYFNRGTGAFIVGPDKIA